MEFYPIEFSNFQARMLLIGSTQPSASAKDSLYMLLKCTLLSRTYRILFWLALPRQQPNQKLPLAGDSLECPREWTRSSTVEARVFAGSPGRMSTVFKMRLLPCLNLKISEWRSSWWISEYSTKFRIKTFWHLGGHRALPISVHIIIGFLGIVKLYEIELLTIDLYRCCTLRRQSIAAYCNRL